MLALTSGGMERDRGFPPAPESWALRLELPSEWTAHPILRRCEEVAEIHCCDTAATVLRNLCLLCVEATRYAWIRAVIQIAVTILMMHRRNSELVTGTIVSRGEPPRNMWYRACDTRPLMMFG